MLNIRIRFNSILPATRRPPTAAAAGLGAGHSAAHAAGVGGAHVCGAGLARLAPSERAGRRHARAGGAGGRGTRPDPASSMHLPWLTHAPALPDEPKHCLCLRNCAAGWGMAFQIQLTQVPSHMHPRCSRNPLTHPPACLPACVPACLAPVPPLAAVCRRSAAWPPTAAARSC